MKSAISKIIKSHVLILSHFAVTEVIFNTSFFVSMPQELWKTGCMFNSCWTNCRRVIVNIVARCENQNHDYKLRTTTAVKRTEYGSLGDRRGATIFEDFSMKARCMLTIVCRSFFAWFPWRFRTRILSCQIIFFSVKWFSNPSTMERGMYPLA